MGLWRNHLTRRETRAIRHQTHVIAAGLGVPVDKKGRLQKPKVEVSNRAFLWGLIGVVLLLGGLAFAFGGPMQEVNDGRLVEVSHAGVGWVMLCGFGMWTYFTWVWINGNATMKKFEGEHGS